ncbi:MAG: glycosyltransferase [Tannerella sp.]|jgi:glycosyltransferase involved in cell wall biosynthesis|nr:glycosyltransferase [Tannerella sp.]
MENLFVLTPIESISVAIAGGLFILQFFYWIVIYARPLRKASRMRREKASTLPVSVVVYAGNESENLQKYLPSLLTQKYPEYEVIVVNDGSTDETNDVLKSLEQKYSHLYYTYIPEEAKYLSRKKLALTLGIKAAKYDILLFTEANCQPVSDQWIASISSAYTPDTEIVLGFCAYQYTKGFVHQLIAYDNLVSGLQYISSALAHRPFTGNGRNLSYRKELFFRNKGYYKSLALHAGDDDLFINESASRKNTQVVYSPESITQTPPVTYFRIWRDTKVSRASTQRYYKGASFLFFRWEKVTYFLFLFTSVAIIIMGVNDYENWLPGALAGSLFLIRYIIKSIVLYRSAKMLQQKPTTGWLFVLEFIHPLFDLYVGFYRMFRRRNDYTFRLR